jgi:hypothetical protein
MKNGKAPGFWFYTADYEKDVQILSLASQGLWSRMLCWAHDNEPHRGFLELPTGEPMSKWDIASRAGKTIRETEKCLEEMKRVGTYSLDGRGCIYCRRMARETHISEVRRVAAKVRSDASIRAADGSFAGSFAPAKQPANEEQNPTVTASVSVSVSDSSKNPCAVDTAPPPKEIPDPKPPETHGTVWFDREHDRWYLGYWNHTGKQNSRRAFEKRVKLLVKSGKSHDAAVDLLIELAARDRERFEPTSDWEWRARLHPATWLNGERWNDEPAKVGKRALDSPALPKAYRVIPFDPLCKFAEQEGM